MTRDKALQALAEQHDAGEIDADDYEVGVMGIEYAYGEAQSAQDMRAEA